MGLKKKTKAPKVWQDIIPAKNIPRVHVKRPSRLIEIKISLPHFLSSSKLLKLKSQLSKIPKKIWWIGLVLIVVIIVSLGVYNKIINNQPSANNPSNNNPVITDADSNQPKYTTITPVGKDINQLGGWTRVSPVNRNPVFAYADHIGNIPITVSQQPVPSEFDDDTASQIDLLAAGYNANEKITVGDISVHIGTSAKGPQSVIFTKKGLLILIKSSAKISNDSWATYINSLN